jgi:hypothetical protein
MIGLDSRAPCGSCKHLRPDGYTPPSKRHTLDAGWCSCNAFPQGIPDLVTGGKHDHRTPLPGDHGIQYEPDAERVRRLDGEGGP